MKDGLKAKESMRVKWCDQDQNSPWHRSMSDPKTVNVFDYLSHLLL